MTRKPVNPLIRRARPELLDHLLRRARPELLDHLLRRRTVYPVRRHP